MPDDYIEIPTAPPPKKPKSKSQPAAWRTEDELGWLKRIGRCWRREDVEGNPSLTELERRCALTRDDLLRRYRDSMRRRHRWGNIDRFAVMKYLYEVLGDET